MNAKKQFVSPTSLITILKIYQNTMDYATQSVAVREATGGQIFTGLKAEPKTKEELSVYYSPGIAGPCKAIAGDKNLSKKLTIRKNTVAVISDGSAVLGLGNIGAEAGLPVMEGKCMLFKHFGGVDGIPIMLDTQDIDEMEQTILNIAPTFGGINLEDIAAPKCFELEERLKAKLDIPIFHDDQHGTAICTLAALINAVKITDRKIEDIKVVFSGAGAAGIATAKLFRSYGVKNIVMTDSKGIVDCRRPGLSGAKMDFCTLAEGDLGEAMKEADVFVGVSKADILKPDMVKNMKPDPIIFAMANPDPEIKPELAAECGVRIMATGRSDYPNQINNVLVFPGIFRGAFDAGVNDITEAMKLAAAEGLAAMITNPTPDRIIPSPFDEGVAKCVAAAVREA